jgi:hypothetical protein
MVPSNSFNLCFKNLLESIPELHKRLKIRALGAQFTGPHSAGRPVDQPVFRL